MMTNLELVLAFLDDVWNHGHLDKIKDYLATEYTIHSDPGDPWDGQTLDVEGFVNRVRLSREPLPDQCFKVTDAVAEADKVAISWDWQGTHLGQIAGFPATGKTLEMKGLTIYYLSAGRICGHRQMVDRLSIFQQLSAK